MESVCRFIPNKEDPGSIQTIRFVLEGKFHSLSQPFYHPVHYLFLVVSGSGMLKLNGKEFLLKRGSIFFSFPQYFYTIHGSEDFAYVYISFRGKSATELLDEIGACADRPVFNGFERLIEFWTDSVRRITSTNANLLTEGVLQYTFAMLVTKVQEDKPETERESRFAEIINYLDCHYTDSELSLNLLAEQFSYAPKYLSRIFKQNMDIGFSKYLNNLRIQYACRQIEDGNISVTQISTACGFSDPMYFSKVFKRHTGCSPQAFIQQCTGKE